MYKGGQIIKSVSNDGTDSTIYSDPILVPKGTTFSLQFDVTEDTPTYAGTVTLWATNQPDIVGDKTSNAGWVQMTASHGWAGFPSLTAGAVADGDADELTVGNAGAYAYRLRFVRSGGAATINAYASIKDNN